MKNIKRIFLSAPLLCSCLLLAATGTASAQEFDDLSVTGKISTLGLGLELKYPFHRKLSGRLVVNQFGAKLEDNYDSSDKEIDLELNTYGLIGDWHPAGNGFRLSAGVLSNNNSIKTDERGTDIDVGETQIDGNLEAEVEWKSLAPYIGLGWSSRKERGFSFDFEFGAMLQGDAILRANGAITRRAGRDINCQFTVDSNGKAATFGPDCSSADQAVRDDFERDIATEHADLVEEFEGFDIYPVLSFGMSYRF